MDKWYEIGNVIAIVDAKLAEDLSAEADYLLASEVADAGYVLLSRSQEATVEEISSTKSISTVHLARFSAGAVWTVRFSPETGMISQTQTWKRSWIAGMWQRIT